jgi:hypothetical protein
MPFNFRPSPPLPPPSPLAPASPPTNHHLLHLLLLLTTSSVHYHYVYLPLCTFSHLILSILSPPFLNSPSIFHPFSFLCFYFLSFKIKIKTSHNKIEYTVRVLFLFSFPFLLVSAFFYLVSARFMCVKVFVTSSRPCTKRNANFIKFINFCPFCRPYPSLIYFIYWLFLCTPATNVLTGPLIVCITKILFKKIFLRMW